MFHHEIPYLSAQQRGEVQADILSDLTRGAVSLSEVNFERAEQEIESRLDLLAFPGPSVT
jgi:hypothetical protein